MSMLNKLCLSLLFCFIAATSANAVTSFTLDNCDGGCAGADVTLEVTDNLDGTYKVLYTIDTTDYIGPRDYLVQVGFKVIQGYTDVDLIGAPNGVASWSEALTAPVSSDGSPCSGGGDNTDKVCIYALSNPLDAKADAIYEFEFKVVGGTIMDTSEWHFGGQWCDTLVCRGGILSDEAGDPPAVPEPSAALLFAIGAVTVGRSLRRR